MRAVLHLLLESKIQDYSATYCTEWDGREGESVAECLQKLFLDEKIPHTINGSIACCSWRKT